MVQSEPLVAQSTDRAHGALVDETLMLVHAGAVAERLDAGMLAMLARRVSEVQRAAQAVGLVRVAGAAGHVLALVAAADRDGLGECHSSTVRRGLEVLTLLAQDAERQCQGHPAAALDDAVECFVDLVEQALRGQRGARIMRFPRSRARVAPAVPAPCPTPTGHV